MGASTVTKAPSTEPPSSAPVFKEHQKEDKDFIWTYTEEPHRSRRMEIMQSHPEVLKLMGHEPLTKWLVLLVTGLQFCAAYALRNTSPLSLQFWLVAYVVGGTANQNLFLAIHEITHNLAFKSIRANRLLAVYANLPIGIPYAMLFKKYHIEHHKFLGEDGVDTDLPSAIEGVLLDNVLGKTFFATFQILFYALRPGFIRAQKFTRWHALNFAVQFSFDYLILQTWGQSALWYFVISSFLAGSLHPCAAHFIAEHYVFPGMKAIEPKPGKAQPDSAQETASYYGWLNALCYNVGYHQEHHDFPAVPWTRLPQLHALAKDVYDKLYSHESWPAVTYHFITDPKVGMYDRVKRPCKSERELKAFEAAQDEKEQGGSKDGYGGVKD